MSPSKLALEGGTPVRSTLLPYGRQSIDDDDVRAVTEALRSPYLTTGPRVGEFESAFAAYVGAKHGVAVSNGTAALHAAYHALGITAGDEVIVPAMTFAATANAAVYCGAKPVFADVNPGTLLLDPASVERLITPRTRAIAAVDYAGQPCDYDALTALSEKHGIPLLSDACHAVGATWKGRKVGTLAKVSTFSFHPVKHFTTTEGGLITTDDDALAARMRIFRNHGITSDHRSRETSGAHFYEMVELGYNYRLPDVACALGLSQLKKVNRWVARRRELAALYAKRLKDVPAFEPLTVRPGADPSWHLFVVRLGDGRLNADRNRVFQALRAENIGVNVHYVPVHLHPFYRKQFGTGPGLCPVAERAYERMITLPLFHDMTDGDLADVVSALGKIANAWTQ